MPITELVIRNFRNCDSQILHFSPHINIFYGQNAQGKTNILEAIALLCLGRSFRTRKDDELIRWEHDSCFLKGLFQQELAQTQIEIGIGHHEKRIKIDGQICKNQELFGKIPVVIFAPDDLQIVKGSPQHRRDFLDFYLAQTEPHYRFIYYNYQRVLQQRNRLLKSQPSLAELSVWDEQLIEKGLKVIKYRLSMLLDVLPYVQKAQIDISGNVETLKMTYSGFNNLPLTEWDENRMRLEYQNELHRVRRQEIERQITLVGPHRDDIRLTFDDQVELRSFGSQGQQRTTVLALKLGLIEKIKASRGEYPILLFDDVMSEFDDLRKQNLLACLLSSAQTVLTSTNRADFPITDHETLRFEVSKGVATNVGECI